MSDVTNLVSSTPFTQAGTPRWMSPELIDPEKFGSADGRPTKPSDCYALGMLIYEVLSGKAPLFQHNRYAVIARILEGERPARPSQGGHEVLFTDDVWGILGHCWQPTPGDRPRIGDVLECLEKASGSWEPSQTIASPPATNSAAHNPDLSDISLLSQGVLSHRSRKQSKGDPNGNHV